MCEEEIQPAGSIKPTPPAGTYLLEQTSRCPIFNSFGARAAATTRS